MKIYELTASRAGVNKTSGTVRFKSVSATTVDQSNPITIPAAGTTNSFTKNLRLYCATAADTYIDNLRVYTDGTGFGTGITVNASNVNAGYAATTTTIAGGSDFFGYTSGSELDLDAYHTASVNATGFCGDILQLQMVVASTAVSGTKAAETVTFAYDEI